MNTKSNVPMLKTLYGIVLGGAMLFLCWRAGSSTTVNAQEAETATPTGTPAVAMTPTPFNFDEDAILAKMIADFNMSSDRDAFVSILAQHESMTLGTFLASAPEDSEGSPWETYFIATQNGSEITIDTRNTEAFTKKLEILYAAGAIDQGWYSILK